MDGVGGRAMSHFDVMKLTLAQSEYYLQERSGRKEVSKQEAFMLQKSMTKEQSEKAKELLQRRIDWANGVR